MKAPFNILICGRNRASNVELDDMRPTSKPSADTADTEQLSKVDVDRTAIDKDEIREDTRVAVQMLSQFGDPAQLAAHAFIDETIDEMHNIPTKPAPLNVAVPTTDALAKPSTAARTIGLCMIVKNETKVIRRCLASVLPLVDYVLVVDTGSTDGTQQMIRDFLAEHNVEGAVIDEPWRDFAYNRSFALERLREVESIDYAMIIDADDTLEFDAGFDPDAFKAQMTHDLYDVPVRHGGIAHHRPQLFSNRLPFSFKGVLHEYLEAPPGKLSRRNGKGICDARQHRRRAQPESAQISGRRGRSRARARDRDRSVPDLALHVLSGAELQGLRRTREGAGRTISSAPSSAIGMRKSTSACSRRETSWRPSTGRLTR